MELMKLLPPIYEGNKTMRELQSILTADVNNMAANLNETVDECFVETATALLSRYEKLYALSVDVTKSDTFRRERIKAKIKGVGTVTRQMIIDTAASYSNGQVEVIEIPDTYSFIIKFVGTKGIPANMRDLTITIEEIKPAHLSYAFEYVYNTWKDISGMTWSEAAAYTWEELRTR